MARVYPPPPRLKHSRRAGLRLFLELKILSKELKTPSKQALTSSKNGDKISVFNCKALPFVDIDCDTSL